MKSVQDLRGEGILSNGAADVLAKKAAEGVPSDDHDKWMFRGGIRL